MTHRETLTFTRALPCSPERTFDALTSAEARQVWGAPDADSVYVIEGSPCAVEGARDTGRVGPREEPYVTVHTDWILLGPAERVVYVETLVAEGAALSTSLVEAEIAASEGGTRLDLTVRLSCYVGEEMMGELLAGWEHGVAALMLYLSAA